MQEERLKVIEDNLGKMSMIGETLEKRIQKIEAERGRTINSGLNSNREGIIKNLFEGMKDKAVGKKAEETGSIQVKRPTEVSREEN